MYLFVIPLWIIALLCLEKKEKADFLPHNQTITINGIFVMLIFLSHSKQYFELQETLFDTLYRSSKIVHSQLIVTTFLAFSGYGIMKSYITKGKGYLDNFLLKRVILLLIKTDIIVLVYYFVNLFLGTRYPFWRLISSLLTWTSVGNSNWYITAILYMYSVSFISFLLFKNPKAAAWLNILWAGAYFFLNRYLQRPEYCYNTIGCFSLGMIIAVYEPYIVNILRKSSLIVKMYYITLLIFAFLFMDKWIDHASVMNVYSCVFVMIIIVLMDIVTINSKVLMYLGENAFYFYMLQRIPMIVMKKYNFFENDKYLFVIMAWIITILLAKIVKVCFQKLDLIITSVPNNNLK